MTPAEIAARLTPAQKRALCEACKPVAEQRYFPGLLSALREGMLSLRLVESRGYFLVATPLGVAVRAVIEREAARDG